MSKVFLKQEGIQLVNGGYLSDSEENPVNNEQFVAAQRRAHRLVSIAAKMEGKTFEAQEVTNIDSLISEVDAELGAVATEEFVKVPVVKKGEVTADLAKEALAFIEGEDKVDLANKINARMQEFKVLNEFETFGLFFEKGVVKLDKIYTVKEVVDAAKTVYAVLD